MRSGYVFQSIFLVLAMNACNWTTTRELLDLAFLDKVNRKFQITAPSIIESGTPFNVVVIYTDANGGKSAGRFADFLQWDVIGSGSLQQTSAGTITSGVYQTTLIYTNSGLTQGQSTNIVAKVTDPNNSSVSGISGSISARFPVSLSTFKFSTPTLAYQTTGFSVTISATGTDGNVFTSYNGTANLMPTVTGMTTPDGTLTPSSVTFTNGVATISNMQYSKPAGSLYINATDSSDNTKKGKSNGIQIAGDAFSLTAVPIDSAGSDNIMDAIRVSWTTPQSGSTFRIYRETSPGVFTLISGMAQTGNSYLDQDASLVLGQTYNYKVEARDGVGNLLKDGTIQTQLKSCATTVSSNITSATNWTTSGSPYCLTAAITLTATLTIDPGVVILASGGTGTAITIGGSGTIKSNGTLTQPVIFTAAGNAPAAPAWGGIYNTGGVANDLTVTTSSGEITSEAIGPLDLGTTLRYTVIEYAQTALIIQKPTWVENCLLRLNKTATTAGDAAGIRFDLGSQYAVIRNSAMVQNTATSTAAGDIVVNGGNIVFKNNIFQGSTGGLWFHISGTVTLNGNAFYSLNGGSSPISSNNGVPLYIRNNLFSGTSGSFSSAISGDGIMTISGNTFEKITVGNNGVISSRGTISGNVFNANTSVYGGSIYIYQGATTVINNVFINTRSNGGSGGAIQINSDSNTIQGNSFYGTYAYSCGGCLGGAIYVVSNSNIISYNNFKDTYTYNLGGAIYVSGSGSTISHNTFNNTRKGGPLPGGAAQGIYNIQAADYTVSNNWWGSDYSAVTACQAVASNLCETTQASKPTLTGNRSTAWPLCCDPLYASDPNCVGASTLPTGQACN